jgi:CubicO group peptidase (beta-lactamase class C family)
LTIIQAAAGQTVANPQTAQVPGSSWPAAAPSNAGLSDDRLKAMSAAIRTTAFKKIGSVLIARHGKLVFEDYVDGDAATLRDTRSATKTITGMLVGMAIQEGKLSGVNAKVFELLPEHARRAQNPDPRKNAITVEDFLTMSSALECDDWNDASRGNEERMYTIEDWTQFVFDLPVRGHMRVGEKADAPPYGRYFSYCTGGAFTLSEVLQKTTGMRTDRYAQANLFAPLGVEQAEWVYSPLDIPQTGGGLRLTSRNLLKLGQLYLDGGLWQGRQLLNSDWIKASTQPHARVDETTEYGYFWWIKTFHSSSRNYRGFFMSGNGGNKVVIIPDLDLVAVITSTNFNTHGMHEQTETLLTDYILAAAEPAQR